MHLEWVSIREWVAAAGVLALSAVATIMVRASLKKFASLRRWPLLVELAPSAASLLYILGLALFGELAPLNKRLEVWLDGTLYVLTVIILLRILRRAAMVTIEWTGKRSDHSSTLQLGFIPLLRNLITLFVFFSGAIMVLKHFDYDVMSLITALGVGSLAVGLAAKDTLSNMISGFTLIIDRNLRPGDRINLGGAIGDVEEIGLRSTRLRTGDGNTLIVPNSDLVNTKILNLSLPSRQCTCMTSFGLDYAVPFARLKQLCLETVAQVALGDHQRAPWVTLDRLTDGYQAVTTGFWLKDMDDQGAALTDFHEKLLARLEREGIALRVPPILPLKAR